MVQEGKIMIGYQPLGMIVLLEYIWYYTTLWYRNCTQPSVVPYIL